jgi:glycosyltransferase involved in cell wall biosynthesis
MREAQPPTERLQEGLSVFFPAYNEEGNLEALTLTALSVLRQIANDYEVILVNDGSRDRTRPLAEALARQHAHVRVVHHPENRGYGAALQSGFRHATKELVFYTDADRQFDIAEISKLLPYIAEYEIVAGYRIRRQDRLHRRLLALLYRLCIRIFFGLQLKDVNCAFKLYKRQSIADIPLKSEGALINAELLVRALRKGCRVKQIRVCQIPER